MNRTLYASLGSIFVMLMLFGMIFYGKLTIIFPIAITLTLILASLNFYLTRQKVKNGTFLKVGSKKISVWNIFFWFALGTYFIYSGITRPLPDLSWQGIDFRIFVGILSVPNILFQYTNYIILFRDDAILFNDSNSLKVWRISKIDKVVIYNNHITFTKKDNKKKFAFDDDVILKMKEFLEAKLKDRLEII